MRFLKLLSTKNVPLDDVENVKHEIKCYEKELNNMKNLFKLHYCKKFLNIVKNYEHFFNVDYLREDLKSTKMNKKTLNLEKIDRMKEPLDKLIDNLVLKVNK